MTKTSARSPLQPIAPMPEEFARTYREAGYYQPETFPEFIEKIFKKYPDNIAAHGISTRGNYPVSSTETQSWTYRQLEQEAHTAAHHIRSFGISPGDRVILQLPNTLEFLAYMLGAFIAGTLPIFALPKHRAQDLAHYARTTDAALHLFAQGAENTDYWALYADYSKQLQKEGVEPPQALDLTQAPAVHQEQDLKYDQPIADRGARILSENTALFQLSGGTTGLSKLIPRTHADYLYSVRASAEICGVTEETTNLVVLPAAHNFTMSSPGILGSLYRGATLVFAHDPSPQTSFALIQRHQVTQVSLVPPLLQSWLLLAERRSLSLPSLKVIQVGGAKLSPTLARKITPQLGATLQQVAGMAEGLVNYTRLGDDPETVCSTQGRPISPHDEIKVVDERGREVGTGQVGELLTRGPYTIRQYYGADTQSGANFTEDGFYRTGDLVKIDGLGNLEMVGRIKDQINRAGEKISIDELEDAALQLADIKDAIAIGIPDERLGEKVGLALTLQEPAQCPTVQSVRKQLRALGLSEYKLPDQVFVLNDLPLTNVGKISRKDLRSQLAQELLGPKHSQ